MKKSTRSPAPVNPDQLGLLLDVPPAWVIYVLCDPRESDPIQRIRYVGVTRGSVKKRFQNHITESRRGVKTYKCNWVRSLLAIGLLPILEEIDIGASERSWDNSEISWIRHFRDKGCPLTNTTDGGDGTPGHVVSQETRMKIGEANRNMSYENRMLLVERNINRIWTEEARAKAAETARNITNETREKISKSGRKLDPVMLAEIERLLDCGILDFFTYDKLANMFHVSVTTVHNISTGRHWICGMHK